MVINVSVLNKLIFCFGHTPLSGPTTCSSNQWQCIGTSHCLEMNQVCDGNNDCGDNSDEGTHCCECF